MHKYISYNLKILLFFVSINVISISNYGQIIADHRVVDQYDEIPQRWIDSVKTKWAVVVGASHAEAYLNGCDFLEEMDATYAWSKGSTGPLPYTDQYLRLDKWIWGDFQDPTGGWQSWSYNNSWWTAASGVELMKENFHYCIDNGFDLFAIWFGWSYDAVWDPQLSGTNYDPVYHTRWGGGVPRWPTPTHEGRANWGLDDEDYALTGNTLSMQSYIDTTNAYIQYCADNDLDIKIVFSTGAVDDDQGEGTMSYGESGYQQYLKWEYIRDYVNTLDNEAYFIDYADILTFNDAGEQATTTWTDNNGTLQTFPVIHPENNLGTQSAHIGNVGALKIAKATWWLLARMAGWNGTVNGEDATPPSIPADLSATSVSESSVEISWSASTDNVGVTGYTIYRDGVMLGNIASTSYTDNTVEACTEYTYTVKALDAAGNESNPSDGLTVNTCTPDLAPTLIVTPNISHGMTSFDVIVRVTELNMAQTSGEIVIQIPIDSRWSLDGSFDQSLTILDGMPLDNSDWSHATDATYHTFTTSASVASGGNSTFGFTITFDPGTTKGEYTITAQLVDGSGGETRDTNNTDSERLDYFPEVTEGT